MKHSPDRTAQLALAGLVAIWFAFCWPWFFEGRIIPADAKNHFYPMIRFAAAMLHDGESAAWSPFHFGGFPMLADPQSTLLTPSLWLPEISSAMPSMFFVDAVQLFHLLAIGAALFAFGKGRGWHTAAALAAALSAMMGGALAIRLEHVLMTVSTMWLCIALWRLDRALRHGTWWRGALFGLALGLMLVDRDHVAYLGSWFLLFFWLSHAVPQALNSPFRATLENQIPVILGGVLAIAIAALPVILLLQLAENSNRPNFGFETASWQSLHPAALASFILPEYFGSLRTAGDYWGPAGGKWGGPDLLMHRGMLHLYSGALPVVLIYWQGILRRRLFIPGARFFAVSAVISLFYALGRYTPFFSFLYDFVPGVDLFRRPADSLFIFGLAVSLLAGVLLDDALCGAPRAANKLSKAGFAAAAGVPLYLLALMAAERGETAFFLSSLGIFLLFAALMGGLLALSLHHKGLRAFALGGLIVLTSADLIAHGSGIRNNAQPLARYRILEAPLKEPVFAKLGALLEDADPSGAPWRIETIGLGPVVQNVAQVARFHNLLGYNPIRLQGFSRHLAPDMQNNAANIRNFGDMMTGYRSPLTNRLGIRYIVTGAPIGEIDPAVPPGRFRLIETIHFDDPVKPGGRTAHLYENPDAEPRAVVFAENGAPVADAAHIIRYGNAEIEIAVESAGKGLLVLHDFDYPGWRASVNGTDTPIVRHDDLFRAVEVPPGKSRVIFRFDLLSMQNLRAALRQIAAAGIP